MDVLLKSMFYNIFEYGLCRFCAFCLLYCTKNSIFVQYKY